jgi:hypothetical protein
VACEVWDKDQRTDLWALDLNRAWPSARCHSIVVGGICVNGRVVGPVYGGLLLAVRLHQVHGLGRHDRGNGVLIDQL